jgi:hypothetical protein
VKTLVKIILSRLSISHSFYLVIEKTYIFVTLNRFKRANRSGLVELCEQISSDNLNGDYQLIRVGSSHDGGYVMMHPRSTSCKVISLGIADNMEFEIELVEKNLVSAIFCFDGSIEKMPAKFDAIEFECRYIKAKETENSLTLSQVLVGIYSEELILKIDIEGDEWEVLDSLSKSELRKFSQIVGEFHGFASNMSDVEVQKMTTLLKRINGEFHLVNLHPNNWSQYRIIQGIPIPDVIELTFINRSISPSFPHATTSKDSNSGLNSPCNSDKFEYLFK